MNSSLKDKLEIILITYNRENSLHRTLKYLLSNKSPVKDLDIKILNNNSTDNTESIINEYSKKYKNIKSIRNNKNIGGNANIARAFELAEREYIWVLCDDDHYNFSNWSCIQESILSNKYNAIFTIKSGNNISDIFYQCTFVPSCIYKVENFEEYVLENMYCNIPNMFPHLAIISDIINNKKQIKFSDTNIVLRGQDNDSKETYLRGLVKDEVNIDRQNMFWYIGYLNSIRNLIKDKLDRKNIIKGTAHCCNSFSELLKHKMLMNKKYYSGYFKNMLDIFMALPIEYKITMFIPNLVYISLYEFFDTKNFNKIPSSIDEWIIYFNKNNTIEKLSKNLLKNKNKTKLLYGTGMITQALLRLIPNLYKSFDAVSDIKVTKNETIYNSTDDNIFWKIKPEDIKDYDIDVIFVSVFRKKAVEKTLKTLGVKSKIISII